MHRRLGRVGRRQDRDQQAADELPHLARCVCARARAAAARLRPAHPARPRAHQARTRRRASRSPTRSSTPTRSSRRSATQIAEQELVALRPLRPRAVQRRQRGGRRRESVRRTRVTQFDAILANCAPGGEVDALPGPQAPLPRRCRRARRGCRRQGIRRACDTAIEGFSAVEPKVTMPPRHRPPATRTCCRRSTTSRTRWRRRSTSSSDAEEGAEAQLGHLQRRLVGRHVAERRPAQEVAAERIARHADGGVPHDGRRRGRGRAEAADAAHAA